MLCRSSKHLSSPPFWCAHSQLLLLFQHQHLQFQCPNPLTSSYSSAQAPLSIHPLPKKGISIFNTSKLFFSFFLLPPLQLLTLSSPAAPHSLPTSMALSWPTNMKLQQPFLSSHFLCCSTALYHSFLLSPATKFLPPNLFVFSPVSGSSHLCLS